MTASIYRLGQHFEDTSPTRRWAYMTGAFLVAHLAAYAVGLRFYTDTLIHFMHFLDPVLLRERLWESLYYLHIQPPLFNLYLGVILKTGERIAPILFFLSYLSLGYLLYGGLYRLQVNLGVRRAIAFVTSTGFMMSPAFLLYEHWLFYTFPCAAGLLFSHLALEAYLRTRKIAWLWAFFGIIGVLCLTRTIFHLVYFLVVLSYLRSVRPALNRHILVAAMLPFLIVLGVYLKNFAVFGHFTTSTWSGKNLWIKTVGNMTALDRETLIRSGVLTKSSRLARYNELGYYPSSYADTGIYGSVPVLSERSKSTGGINYNHIGYIRVSEDYARDAWSGLVAQPKAFALSTVQAGSLYLASPTDYDFVADNQEALRWWKWVYETPVYGRVPINLSERLSFVSPLGYRPCIVLLIAIPLLMLLMPLIVFCRGINRYVPDRTQRIVLGFMVLNLFFVGVIGVGMEMVETNRFRFMVDPLYVASLGVCLQCWIGRKPFVQETTE